MLMKYEQDDRQPILQTDKKGLVNVQYYRI